MTKQDLLKRLRARLHSYPNQKTAAAALNITPQYLADIIAGRREPGPKLLTALGLRRAITYTEEK